MPPSSTVSSVAPSSATLTSSVPQVPQEQMSLIFSLFDEFNELQAENVQRLDRLERWSQGVIDGFLGDEDSGGDDDGEPEIAMDWIPVVSEEWSLVDQDQQDEDSDDDDENYILDFSDGEGEDILADNFSVMATNEAIEANDTDVDFNLPFDLPFELPFEEPISHPA